MFGTLFALYNNQIFHRLVFFNAPYNKNTHTMNKGNNKITEQSYKGKVKTHKYINRQNQSTTGKL